MTIVPLLLCFDKRILLGAGVTILSLIEAAKTTTAYEIHIFHPDLGAEAQAGFESLVAGTQHRLLFHFIDPATFAGMPRNRGSWTEIVYYRLIASRILTNLDRIIYSDVDVVICQDLAEVYAIDLEGFEWAGVAAERNGPDTIGHRHFPENSKDKIYFSGFMVMNLARMRAVNAVDRYFEVIRTVGERLKFFDLDVLNIGSSAIKALPFRYVTLEDVYEMEDVRRSADYAYLKTLYSAEELLLERDNAAIIHYAGRRGKPWQRQAAPPEFAAAAKRLPASLKGLTFRDFRKKWFSKKGWKRWPMRARPSA